jgi:hypothetical protein
MQIIEIVALPFRTRWSGVLATTLAALASAFIFGCGNTTSPGANNSTDAGGETGPPDDAAAPDACAPTCETNACGVDDGCGGQCTCAAGVECVSGTCGGCLRISNDECVFGDPKDGSSPTSCCAVGFSCKPYGTGAKCCGVTAQGGCVRDTDCCDYGSGTVHCNTLIDGGVADSGSLPGLCE